MPRTIRAGSPSALLSLIPTLVGRPASALRNSVVSVAMQDNHTLGALRVNLPDEPINLGWFHEVDAILARVEHVTGAIHVVYTDGPVTADHPQMVAAGLVGMSLAGAATVPALEVYVIGADGWCVPGEPVQPLSLIHLADPDFPEPALKPDPLSVPEVSADGLRQFGTITRTITPELVRFVIGQRDVTDDIVRAIDTHSLAGAAWLGGITSGPRGQMLTALTAGWGAALGRAAHDDDDLGAYVLAGQDFPRPTPARIEQAIDALTAATGYVAPANRAGLYFTCSVLRWFTGDSSTAMRYLEAAEQIDVTLGSAPMRFALDHGMLPSWAFRTEPETERGQHWAALLA